MNVDSRVGREEAAPCPVGPGKRPIGDGQRIGIKKGVARGQVNRHRTWRISLDQYGRETEYFQISPRKHFAVRFDRREPRAFSLKLK